MQGLELSERYWREVGRPALAAACPEAAARWCAGLAGEGSECFGYDDETSRDHDWGPGFCVWLDPEDFARFGAELQRAYDALPRRFAGFERREEPEGAGRVGVLDAGAFYRRFIGLDEPPRTVGQWLALDDEALALCVNGRVFEQPADDAPCRFMAMRAEFEAYYPEDIRLKKLAAHCALAAQAGQYNYARCLRRGEAAAALEALGRFVHHVQAAAFLLNRRYRPYYKWANRALADLPREGMRLAARLDALAAGNPLQQEEAVEEVSGIVIGLLRGEGLSASGSDFLLDHARQVQAAVRHEAIRELPLMVYRV